MTRIAHDCGPITGRGVGYKLFVAGLIPSVSRRDMAGVYRLLKEEREYRSGRSRDWLKMKNPNAPAVKREAEEDWGR
jgi:hypothetical protein